MNLDQHFLKDEAMAELAVSMCKIKKTDVVVEIGPGNGELTKFIPECKLTLIEKDKRLAGRLKPNYKVILGNGVEIIKKIDFDVLISSVPYSICEPLMRELFLHEFRVASLIMPKNFVDNIESNETSLSFLAKEFLEIKIVKDIERENFFPMPRVDSYLVEIKPKKAAEILKKMYLQQDKKVKNALREAIVEINSKTKKQANEAIKAMKISPKTLDKNVRMLSFHELKYIKEATK